MKKTKLFIFLAVFGLSISFFIPTKVFAQINPDGLAEHWYGYISQYKYGKASALVMGGSGDKFYLFIEDSPTGQLDIYIEYDVNNDLNYFEPVLREALPIWAANGWSGMYDLGDILEDYFDLSFGGYFYWNFEEEYWQIRLYELSEVDYYKQELEFYKERVSVLEDLVTNLTNQLHSRNIQIQMLNGEINSLLNEIQYLENALESEYDRGYSDGVLATESEAYEQGFIDGQKSKLAENNEKFYNGIEKWLVPAIITVIALGGFVTIASIKRREV